jgi:tetratricopeptide (TPR) repeat protein
VSQFGAPTDATPPSRKLPHVWNVPPSRNPTFTGRDGELAALRRELTSGLPNHCFQAVSGLGGIGKTQLALEYAYRFASEYDVVWWLRAEEPAQLAADFNDLAAALRVRARADQDQRVSIEAAKKWLSQHGGWLLVFDSAREPAHVAPYLTMGPQAAPNPGLLRSPSPAGTGHVIITSRHASWRGVAMPLALRGLDRRDAVAFLLDRSGATDDGSAYLLAEALGDLPLALAQAGAYMEESGSPIGQYLDLFEKRQRELLRRGGGSETAPTVATTWDIAFKEAQSRSPAAGELLRLAAFLAPDDIPRDGLVAGAEHFPKALAEAVSDPLILDEAVAALRRCSLVEVQEAKLSVHRLVQAVVRDRLSDTDRAVFAECAVRLVFEGLSSDIEDAPTGGEDRGRWLPHVRAVVQHAEAAGVVPEVAEQLLILAAKVLRENGAYADARVLLEKARSIAEALHEPDHAHLATIYIKLSRVLEELDETNEALPYAERALAIDLRLYGEDHPSVARDYNGVARVLRLRGDLPGALRHLERAIAIDERLYGPEDPELIPRQADLGFLRRQLGDAEGAREVLERAMARGLAAWGPDHPEVGAIQANIAGVLSELAARARKAGDAATERACLLEARRHFERSIQIGEATHGPRHYVISIRRNNFGLLLRDLGDLPGAYQQIALALEIMRDVFGPSHRRVAQFQAALDVVERELHKKGIPLPVPLRKPTPPPRPKSSPGFPSPVKSGPAPPKSDPERR